MKKYIFLLSSVILMGGCVNDLDLSPISDKNSSSFYKTQSQFDQAIAGCYNGLRSAALKEDFSYMLSESRSDNAWQQVDYDDGAISRFTENAATPVLNRAWASLYNTILRCNYILVNLETATITEESKKILEGEARFIRALIYFDLVRYFGGIPIVEKPLSIIEAYEMSKRSSVADIYSFIIKDLTVAKSLLPNVKPSSKPNRATSYAAQGFLGKVLVTRAGYPLMDNTSWSLAKVELEAVLNGIGINNGFFAKYEDIFTLANENKDQSVFSLGCKGGASGEGNPFPTRNAPNSIKPGNTPPMTIPYGGSPFNIFLSNDLVNEIFLESGDLRKTYAVQPEWEDKSGNIITTWPYVKKYQEGTPSAPSDWDIDWILLRFTDVYLLYAEACYFTGDKNTALTILNKVRTRAGLPDLSAADISTDSAFIDRMLKERRCEFCFENQRWFELVRTDRALDVMKTFLAKYNIADNIKSRSQYVYPIPQSETNVSGLE